MEAVSAAQLLAKKEAEDESMLVKTEVKAEEVELMMFDVKTPAKRKRAAASSSVSASRNTKSRKTSTPKTVKKEMSTLAAVAMYPTPPETPSSVKTADFDYFSESPISLVERVKRTRTPARTRV
jgi:hypothetical protein